MGRETRGSPASEKKLEQYGVWVKAGPREAAASSVAEEALELSDLETAPEAEAELPDITDESPLTSEEEKLLDELETEMEPDVSADAELPELTLEPAPRESAARDEVEVTLSDSLPMEEHFDDLQALEDELASVTGTAAAAAAPAGAGQSDAILARIEEELRSIRTDLTELKKELSGLRKPGVSPGPSRPEGREDKAGTFFDEEEDETIALTGDELDNILNTAEITEETPEVPGPAEEPLLGDALEPAILSTADTPAPADDILDYDTPVLDEDKLLPSAEAEDILELEAEPEEAQGLGDDLAADLVLEEPSRPAPAATPVDTFADLELEGLPEIEMEEEHKASRGSEEESSAGEPAEMPAPAEVEALEDLEAAEDLEAVSEVEEQSARPAAAKGPADEVDLEALALEAQEPGDTSLLELENELELAELEPVAEDKEIRIDFEAEPAPARAPGKAALAEESLEVEELAEVETEPGIPAASAKRGPAAAAAAAASAGRTPGAAPAASVPEDLKDEIRAVLKYMDHLLEALPEEKIQEFAGSDYFVMYKKLFEDLGLGE